MKPTAFHKWIMQSTGGDIDKIADLLLYEIVNNKNKQAFDLLDASVQDYIEVDFKKVAEYLVSICNEENGKEAN